MPQVFITKIKSSFFDSLYYLLDGLVHLAFSDDEPLLISEFDAEGGAARHSDKVRRLRRRLIWKWKLLTRSP